MLIVGSLQNMTDMDIKRAIQASCLDGVSKFYRQWFLVRDMLSALLCYCPSVCLSLDGSVKNGQLGSCNFHHLSSFLRIKFHPEILTGSP